MVAAGLVRPDAEGRFAWHDVHRARMVRSYIDAGIGLEQLEDAVRRGLLSFDYIDEYFLEPSPLSGRRYAEFRTSLGEIGARLGRTYQIMGLPEPEANRPMRLDEERILTEFLTIWGSIGDDQLVDRAARSLGENVRRIIDVWLGLWVERMVDEAGIRAVSPDAGSGKDGNAVQRGLDLSHRLAKLVPDALVWLEQRLLEQQLNALNAELFERGLAHLGLGAAPPEVPPAVAFVDLAGFTRLTEELGDATAAEYGGLLRDAAEEAAGRHGGRLVKLLGDGAMLVFPSADAAVTAALELLGPVRWPQRLPPAHVGVHSGPVIERDGDFFGRTVNLAARLSASAAPGTVLVTDETVAAVPGGRFLFRRLGPIRLRNVPRPVECYEARALDDPWVCS